MLSGVKLESQFNGYQYAIVAQYNPNTGKKLNDHRVIECLLKWREDLICKVAKVDHQIEVERGK